MNHVTITGRLGSEPEIMSTQSGRSYLRVSIAVSSGYRSRAGEWMDRTTWVPVIAWGRTAERMVERLSKGAKVLIEGRLDESMWTKDGRQMRRLRVVVDRWEAMDGTRRAASAGSTYTDVYDREPILPEDTTPF